MGDWRVGKSASKFILALGPADSRSGDVCAAGCDGGRPVVPRNIAASSWRSLLPTTMWGSVGGPGDGVTCQSGICDLRSFSKVGKWIHGLT